MATREYREFFLRAAKLATTTKKDQQVNYPIDYTVIDNGVTKSAKNRFLKGHYPSEDVFRKLFESVAFHLNTESSATLTQQGLVKKATTAEINAGTASNVFPLFVDPSQLQAYVAAQIALITNKTKYVDDASYFDVSPTTNGDVVGSVIVYCGTELSGRTNESTGSPTAYIYNNVVIDHLSVEYPVYGFKGDTFVVELIGGNLRYVIKYRAQVLNLVTCADDTQPIVSCDAGVVANNINTIVCAGATFLTNGESIKSRYTIELAPTGNDGLLTINVVNSTQSHSISIPLPTEISIIKGTIQVTTTRVYNDAVFIEVIVNWSNGVSYTTFEHSGDVDVVGEFSISLLYTGSESTQSGDVSLYAAEHVLYRNTVFYNPLDVA